MTAIHQQAILPGQLLGRCKVAEQYADKHGHLRWTLDCLDCGRRSHIGSTALREHMRGAMEFHCPWCRPGGLQSRKFRAAPATCSFCHVTGHTRKSCPERDHLKSDSQWCRECSGLPWRRENPVCSGCGEHYAPERMPTLDDAMNAPRKYHREVVL